MNYDQFLEDHSEALDRFIEEYKKHQNRMTDQFQFLNEEYVVQDEDIREINQNIVRIRELKEQNSHVSTAQLDERYSLVFRELADQLDISVDEELIVEDIERAREIMGSFARTAGEWLNCSVKYFGFIDGLDGVHRSGNILSFIHSNSQYHAIHIGIFKRMVLLRPKEDILLIILEFRKSPPFLKGENITEDRMILDDKKFQMIYRDFFGVKYHIRLFLKEGDALLFAPSYLTRRGFNPSILEESLLYPGD